MVELERAIHGLGLKGATLFSNANGAALSEERFWPMYEKANEMNLTFFIHPTYPVGVEAMLNYMLMPLVGFLADTTLAAASLVFSGVTERFPKSGGSWVTSAERFPILRSALIEDTRRTRNVRKNINKPPSAYLCQISITILSTLT